MALSLPYTDAFEQAIREEPDQSAHRLVYADWLEDLDDPVLAARGEFIRLQCQRECLKSDDPRKAACLSRERELWNRFGRVWATPVSELVGSYEFRRGFVEKVRLDAADFLRHAGRILELGPITEVELAVRSGNLPALAHCSNLHRVTALDIHCSGCDPDLLQRLFETPALAALKTLRVRALQAPALHALVEARHWKSLTTLDLASNPVGSEGVEALAYSGRLPGLRTLFIHTCQLTMAGVVTLAGSPLLGQLRALDLRSNSVTSGGVAALAWAPGVRNLRVLCLGFNAVGDAGLAALASSARLLSLRRLYLACNQIHGTGLTALAQSVLLSRLTHLDLDYNSLSAAGVKSLVNSPYLSKLQTLYLRCGPVLTPRDRQLLQQRLEKGVCRF